MQPGGYMNYLRTVEKKQKTLSGDAVSLVYDLTSSEFEEDDVGNWTSYGIAIKLSSTEQSGMNTTEYQNICDISTDFEKVRMLFDSLVEQIVTPMTLRDIAEDFVAFC